MRYKSLTTVEADLFTDGIVHHDTYPDIDPLTKSDCTGKAVLVTGASRGMGRSLAVGYTQAGASHIALAARSSTAETKATVLEAAREAGLSPPRILSLEMDVCDKASVESAARVLENEWGRLDILINNSGYMAKFAPLLEVDEEEYARVWDVNYWGTFRVTKAFLPILLKGGDKTVVNITSMAAQFAGMGGGAYHVSKFALARFTEFVQDEYGGQVGTAALNREQQKLTAKGVLAYSVHPGGVPTELSANLPDTLRCKLLRRALGRVCSDDRQSG